MATACSDGFVWGGSLQGRGGTATGEGRSRGSAGGEEEQGQRRFYFLAALDMQGWAGAVLEEGAVQGGVQGVHRSGRRHPVVQGGGAQGLG
jgi:hypothetical protein